MVSPAVEIPVYRCARAQYYMVARIKEGLAGLRLRSTKIVYPTGSGHGQACLDGVMSDLVRCGALYT